jgi:uncharacterized protein YkwD
MKCAVPLLLCLWGVPGSAQRYTAQEIRIFNALNQLRNDPAAFVTALEAQRRFYRGNMLAVPSQTRIETQEGTRAVDEAIHALRSLHGPLGPLTLSPGLSRSAAEHVRDTGPRGAVGHGNSNGRSFGDRISQFGTWSGGAGEAISYGDADPQGVVLQLLIDDGVADRGHRQSLLDRRWRYVGISCGAHSVYRGMCVLDFAVGFQER